MTFAVQPIYGWGWRYGGQPFDVPGPFTSDASVETKDDLMTAKFHLELGGHPLHQMWIVLSPIGAVGSWELSHLCAFLEDPAMPGDLKTLVESAPLTGFARVQVTRTD